MFEQQQYLTPEGLIQLENRLNMLKEVRRPEIAERLRRAMEEGGDLSENADYDAAKERQGFIEARIGELHLLPALAREVLVSETVWKEITQARPTAPGAAARHRARRAGGAPIVCADGTRAA